MNKRPTTIRADDDDSEESQESERKQRGSVKPQKLSANPIIATIQRRLQDHGVLISIRLLDSPPATDEFLNNVFGAEVTLELGKMVLRALIDHDKTFKKTIALAVKESDALFNRNLEKAIGDDVFKFVESLPEPKPTGQKLREVVEKRFNGGIAFEEYRWLRLSKILLLPKRPAGRPRKKIKQRTAKTLLCIV